MNNNSLNKFIRIVPLYNSNEERNIQFLSKEYKNIKKLKKIIERLLGSDFLLTIQNKKIFIKPNWVYHNIKSDDDICLRTNDSILFCVLEVILEQKPSSVIVADAPVNVCDWEKILTKKFINRMNKLTNKYKIPIKIMDLRRSTFSPNKNIVKKDNNPISEYIIFDVGKKSFLEPISKIKKSGFRVTNYNPDKLNESHNLGIHKYCITKTLFDCNLFISIPKIKTHEKTGITGALKNLVGLNGDKDFLPHHRFGGVTFGGDCYPGMNIIRLLSEIFRDTANKRQGQKSYKYWIYISDLLWFLSRPRPIHQISAAWYGNDTTWRMVMDLYLIAIYGKKDGTLSNKPQRTIFSLCDGIIGGQGNGPLHPEPLPLGFLSFSNNSVLNDICMARLLGFNINKIPLIIHAKNYFILYNNIITMDGKKIQEQDLLKYSIKTKLPIGWQGYLES